MDHCFRNKFTSLEQLERIRGTTLLGPHRDDWSFFLESQPLKILGSQGEVRSALLALKLVEIRLFQEQTKTNPILLLDDFSSELDRKRRSFLLKFLESTDLQVFVTSTEAVEDLGKRFWVVNGSLSSNDLESDSVSDSTSQSPTSSLKLGTPKADLTL